MSVESLETVATQGYYFVVGLIRVNLVIELGGPIDFDKALGCFTTCRQVLLYVSEFTSCEATPRHNILRLLLISGCI